MGVGAYSHDAERAKRQAEVRRKLLAQEALNQKRSFALATVRSGDAAEHATLIAWIALGMSVLAFGLALLAYMKP